MFVKLNEVLHIPQVGPIDRRRERIVSQVREIGRPENRLQIFMQVKAIAVLRVAPRLERAGSVPVSGRRCLNAEKPRRLTNSAIRRQLGAAACL